jgi:GT2 family glycosyltransferase
VEERDVTISYTIPCHKREEDFHRALPFVLEATTASPPVEIVVVDYANEHDLIGGARSANNNTMRVVRYRGREHYHMAHARNLSIKAATGDFVVISSADICPKADYFAHVRERLVETGADLLLPDICYVGVIVCRRTVLLDAGGYDERFEFYGSEDKDLNLRLRRRGVKSAPYWACDHLTMFRTTNWDKIKNYRGSLRKGDMMVAGKAILTENVRAGVLVANEGREWGVL